MKHVEFLSLLRQLRRAVNPLTGMPGSRDSCLHDPTIQEHLSQLERRLTREQPEDALTETEIVSLSRSLRDLGYQPTPTQLANVLIGSRSVVDPRLRALPAFRKYRGVLTRRVIRERLVDREPLVTGISAPPATASVPKKRPWRDLDFFTSGRL